ncbi:hypothetical protein [Egbenema bharatensis]|uniref:hypothetical protein n=1 Tax=Egbenema bharatensis TaxID=3463334 RepID=UPI003A8A5C47
MSRVAVRSQEEFLLQDLLKLVESLHSREKTGYSQFIEFGVMELVKRQMRQEAIEGQGREGEELLRRAMAQVNRRLQERLEQHHLRFDFTPYFQNTGQQLRYVAREMQELAEQLQQLELQEVPEREVMTSVGQVEFEVREVGLREVEALMVSPLTPECELDLEWLRQSYSVEGSWFPLHVAIEELGFVVDGDGTIFISTENFPAVLLKKARRLMVEVADHLYWSNTS